MPAVDGERATDGVAEHALLLGSNHRPARALRLAVRRISDRFDVIACAPAIRTRDTGGGRYLNAAICVRSDLSSEALREVLHGFEDEAGRVRGETRVALDIDLIASRDVDGTLRVHKAADLQRDFVQALLAEIGFQTGEPAAR
jgi:2-amino-4-hydroxy-6-hydroxymethyldihydropteridine diphosphokinase